MYLVGIFLARAGRGGENGYIHVFQFTDVLHDLILCEFCGLVLCTIAAHDTCYFKVWCSLQSLERILSNVAVTDDGCSDFLHILFIFYVITLFP